MHHSGKASRISGAPNMLARARSSSAVSIRLSDWVGDRRSRYTAELLAILWILALADLFFTVWAHLFTPFTELNPLARLMLVRNMLLALVLYKLTVTLIGSTIFWRLRGHRCAGLALLAVILVYVFLAMRWSDYTDGTIADISALVRDGPVNC